MNALGKRPNPNADSPADPIQQQLASKKVMEAQSTPPLDLRRAELAHRHVRALNTQFASWVQLQLQNHPDELWEDGVKDYLSHASEIMVKFKDVVDWLRLKAAKGDNVSSSRPINDQKIPVDVPEDNRQASNSNVKNGLSNQASSSSLSNLQTSNSFSIFSFSQKPEPAALPSNGEKRSVQTENSKASLFSDSAGNAAKLTTPFSFFNNTTSQSSGLFSFNQKPPTFSGSQIESTSKVEASGDADEEDETPKPSSPSLEKHQEQGVIVVHEAKCKLYIKAENPTDGGWKDMGIGQLSIKCKEGVEKATKESKPTIVVRNDVGKVLLNALIYPGIKMNIQKNTIASIFHTSGGGQGNDAGKGDVVARMYLLKLKNNDETTKLAAAIRDYAPSE